MELFRDPKKLSKPNQLSIIYRLPTDLQPFIDLLGNPISLGLILVTL